MKIVVAPDSYKGCLSSREAAEAMRGALLGIDPGLEIVPVPVADGGEGTVEAMKDALSGLLVSDIVSDPLGRPVSAQYCITGDLAVIESAAACGLTLLSAGERKPMMTSSKGLGELILAAIRRGCRRFIIGLGGSATNDGGMGMVSVPGFLEHSKGLQFSVACDVDTPFLGPDGASRVFAPQKGASPAEVEALEERMAGYAAEIFKETGVDVSLLPGAGAAGGLGGAFRAYLGATLKPGAGIVLDAIGFDGIISGADLVITGEGQSDFQTVKGKTPSGILERASRQGIPTALVSGTVKDREILRQAGFTQMESATPEGMPLEEALQPETARRNIGEAVARMFRTCSTSE